MRQQRWAREVGIADGQQGRIKVNCVIAREVGAPAGIRPIEWRLPTNRAVATQEQAVGLINWINGYRARRETEIYFHALMNGYEGESLQLAEATSVDRIERAPALFMVATWRITYLMRKGRSGPERDTALFFDPDEIRGAHLLAKKKMPATPPTVNEVVRLIAQIGGFLARKSDGEPGVKTIWRALDKVFAAICHHLPPLTRYTRPTTGSANESTLWAQAHPP